MKVLQKDLPNPKAQKSVGKKLARRQVKASLFVRGVPGSFCVLFLILPLNHVTLVNGVTCSRSPSHAKVCFSLEPILLEISMTAKQLWFAHKVHCLTRLYARQWTEAWHLLGGQRRLGCSQPSNMVLRWSCLARQFFKRRQRSLREPCFKGDALRTSSYTKLPRRQGFEPAPP